MIEANMTGSAVILLNGEILGATIIGGRLRGSDVSATRSHGSLQGDAEAIPIEGQATGT